MDQPQNPPQPEPSPQTEHQPPTEQIPEQSTKNDSTSEQHPETQSKPESQGQSQTQPQIPVNSQNQTMSSVSSNPPQEEEKIPEGKTEPNPIHIQQSLDSHSFCSISTLTKTDTLKAPFPINLPYELLIQKFKDDYMSEYLIKDKEGIFSTNQEVIKKQSGIIKDIIQQMTKGLLQGGTMSLSLPIRIFEPRTMLERITDWFAFAPLLLKKAGSMENKIESFKQIICFSLSALFRSTQQLKPFNPMLGETYQCFWEDGTKMYLEHTSHIPPVSHFYINDYSDNIFSLSGYFDMQMGGMLKALVTNTMSIIPKGKITVYLKKMNQRVSYQFPKITLGGAIFGQRSVLFDGHMKFEDRENNLKCVIAFNKIRKELKGKRCHDFYGRIFNYDYKKEEKEKKEKPFYEDNMSTHPFPFHNKGIVSVITGSWLEEIKFDDKVYWNIKNSVAPQIFPEKEVLNSDSRYREDRTWLKLSWENKDYQKLYEEYAQKWKLSLEAQQRYERNMRKEVKEKNEEKKKI